MKRPFTSDDVIRTLNKVMQAAARGHGVMLQPSEVQRLAMALLAAENSLRQEDDSD